MQGTSARELISEFRLHYLDLPERGGLSFCDVGGNMKPPTVAFVFFFFLISLARSAYLRVVSPHFGPRLRLQLSRTNAGLELGHRMHLLGVLSVPIAESRDALLAQE